MNGTMTNVNLLKAKMVETGLTQQELADKMNISRVAMNYKLNGQREFTGKEIYTMCSILGIENKDPIFFNHFVE